ncbi:MAG TPA: N-acetylmuramoyl-L-alanine amidase [Solirubrobacterales bacterium]|nr:N-acetylmuramoyl-L-alanine amidase [Solirubrobacterales bacterium]
MIGTHALAALLAALSLAAPHPPAGRAQATAAAAGARPLAGKVVGIDPGHNGGNFGDPGFIDRPVWNGREMEACDTTGTETDGGYTEARFNFEVASYLRADLIAEGAKVVMTRRTNHGVGPCIDRRARILDKAGADVAIDIHADGGPPGGRGVAILTPVPDGPNDHVIAASKRFGRILLKRYTKLTGIPVSDYDGTAGFAPRDNLAGLNLTTVPKVLIECVNMRNATDAARLVKPSFQRLAAKSMAAAITAFLRRR